MIREFNCHEGCKDLNVEKVWNFSNQKHKNICILDPNKEGAKVLPKKAPALTGWKKLLKGDIKSMQGGYKWWKKGSASRESCVLEVRKFRDKVRIARSQAELYLQKKIKASSKKFFSHRHKKRPRGKKKRRREWGKKAGMLCEARVWRGFYFQSITPKNPNKYVTSIFK